MLFSDFMPVGGGPQMIATPLVTAGFDGDDRRRGRTSAGQLVVGDEDANGVQIDPSRS